MTLIIEVRPENAVSFQRIGIVTSAGDRYGTAHSLGDLEEILKKRKKGEEIALAPRE